MRLVAKRVLGGSKEGGASCFYQRESHSDVSDNAGPRRGSGTVATFASPDAPETRSTRPRRCLEGLKIGTTRGGTCTGLPVLGLRAARALRCCTLKVPKLRISMWPPRTGMSLYGVEESVDQQPAIPFGGGDVVTRRLPGRAPSVGCPGPARLQPSRPHSGVADRFEGLLPPHREYPIGLQLGPVKRLVDGESKLGRNAVPLQRPTRKVHVESQRSIHAETSA